MRSISLLFVGFLLIPLRSLAQSSPIDELRAPTTPAFSLMKGDVAAVPVPTTPNEFMADVQNLSTAASLKQNYGIEFTLRSILDPNSNDPEPFLASLEKHDIWTNVSRTAALSIATGVSGFPLDTNGTALSAGFRCNLLSGYVPDSIIGVAKLNVKKFRTYVLNPSRIIGMLTVAKNPFLLNSKFYSSDDVKAEATKAIKAFQNTTSVNMQNAHNVMLWDSITNDVLKIIENCRITDSAQSDAWILALKTSEDRFVNSEKARAILRDLSGLSLNRYGIVWDFSVAAKWDWLATSYDNEHFEKMGVWTSLGYKSETGFNIAALARYLHYTPVIDSSDRFEYGGSLGYHGDKLSIAAEYITHSQNVASLGMADSVISTQRYDMNMSYAFNNIVTASLTIGKDFLDPKAKFSPFLSVLGVNVNWSALSSLLGKAQ
jgi:hypothetical protein